MTHTKKLKLRKKIMTNIEIYTTQWCPYCVKAKALFKKLEQKYVEVNIETEPEKRAEMEERAPGVCSVPQIFINGTHVGGCDELYALHGEGGLKTNHEG